MNIIQTSGRTPSINQESGGDEELFPCSDPCSPAMCSIESRCTTFREWPNHILASRRELAEAGFLYLREGDKVKCFYCNGALHRWNLNEDPWIEHAKWFPNCEHVLRHKGITFVEDVVAQFRNAARPAHARQRRVPVEHLPELPRSHHHVIFHIKYAYVIQRTRTDCSLS
ncbi:unnamed protein product [Clavelina lepadiformis]|uniref:Uncharacterized protein n=1 Tax=Clavelina lepadiformis TaxID=159417 RepID=A0ABP0GMR0_CLALP